MTSDEVFKMRLFSGVVVTERTWLLTEAGSGESVIQSHVPQFGPGGMVAFLAARDVLWC